jgi:REP element-mobilizing transposase RayT
MYGHHLVWSTKYRYQELLGDIRLRVREIIRQVCAENGTDIIEGVISADHMHMFALILPELSVSDLIAQDERSLIPQGAQGVPAVKEAILRLPLLG